MYKGIFLSDYVDCIPNKILTYLGFFFLFFISVILLKNYSRSFYGSLLRRCYDGTNVLGDSDGKTYLIRQRHQFKPWLSVCYMNLLNYSHYRIFKCTGFVSSHYVSALI